VNSATLYDALQIHFAFDLHNRMKELFSKLVNHCSLNVKIAILMNFTMHIFSVHKICKLC
jgi:hypothetical protein